MRMHGKTECGLVSVVIFLLMICVAIPVYGDDVLEIPDNWEIRLMPYVWMFSLDAEGTVGGNSRSLSGNFDLDFDDIVENLDFGAMGRVEVWKDKWGLTFDGLFMDLGASDSFQSRGGGINVNLDADVRLGMADFGLAYRLFENQWGQDNQQRLAFEPYGGLRYGYLKEKIDLNFNIAGVGSAGRTLGTSQDWVEPFVGGRVVWDLNEKWTLHIMGDAGGFGIGSASDLTWQIGGGVDYKISKHTIFNIGYRYLEFDYSRGSGLDELGMDLRAKGPYLGLTILF